MDSFVPYSINENDSPQQRQFHSLRDTPKITEVDDFDELMFPEARKGRMMESVIFNSKHIDIEQWISLQQKLKEEKYRMEQGISFCNIEHLLKVQLLEELKKESESYYKAYINVSSFDGRLSTETAKLFGNANTYVVEVFQNLCNQPHILAAILKHHNNMELTSNVQSLIHTIVNTLYDNVACGEMWNQPIIRLMSEMIEFEINNQTFQDFKWDQLHLLSSQLLREFTRRPENIKYTKVIFKSTLLAITKVDKFLELDRIKISDKVRERRKKEERDRKPQQLSMSTNIQRTTTAPILRQSLPIFQPSLRQAQDVPLESNMAEYYAKLIKQYDISMRQAKDKRKPTTQLDVYSLRILHFNDEQKQAKFLALEQRNSISSESPQKRLQDVYNHAGRSDVQMNNEVNKILIGCIEKFKQLINNLMVSIFNNIYTLPVGLRIVCKLIQINLKKKFPNMTEIQIQDNLFSFIFNVWLIPQLEFPKQYLSFKFIKDEQDHTKAIIHTILKKLVKRQNYDDDPVYEKLNQYIQELQPSLRDYLNEILNLCPNSMDSLNSEQNVLVSNCVCISLQDVKTLCYMLKDLNNFQGDLQPIIQKISKRASLTLQIADDLKLFEIREGLEPQLSYALILDFQLPKDLSADYQTFISPLSKLRIKDPELRMKQKLSNILREILTNIQDLAVSPICSVPNVSLRKVLNFFEEKYIIQQDKRIVQHLQYIQSQIAQLPAQFGNLQFLYDFMMEEYEQRSQEELRITRGAKFQLLRAKFNIHKNYEDMLLSLSQIQQEKRQKHLYDFVESTPFSFCVTSPKTREGLYAVKAMKLRNNSTNQDDQIWLEDQKECIHNAISLEFIKQIVGGASANDQKKNSEFSNSHCSDIKQFIEIFSSLPEVRESVITGEDRAGVKEAYFEFIKAMADHSNKSTDLDNAQVIDMLEKYVSKRIYDKVYPKERTYRDAGLYFRLKTLDWVDYDNLGIQKNNRVDEMWMLAADALTQMDNNKTAVSKLESILNCTKIMTDVLKLTSLKDEATGADTVVPILIKLLIKAAPQRLYSNLNFIQLFMDDSKNVGQQGYCLAQIRLAINFIEGVKSDQLKVSDYKFQELITHNEYKYCLHYIKKRNRQERTILQI